jgi:NADPH:quinone reductase-like Zn-dependent oxidoreductase
MTAALGLFRNLGLPVPWQPARSAIPLIVYGGASTVGAFAIKLASLANIHPIITVAGGGTSLVESLIDRSKGDVIIDYRAAGGNEGIVSALSEALKGQKVQFAMDAISEHDSYTNIGKVLDPNVGRIAVVLPGKKYEMPIPVTPIVTMVGSVHAGFNAYLEKEGEKAGKLDDKEFGAAFFRFFGRGLAEGWFSGHPYKIVDGGLEGVANALNAMSQGKVSGFKFVMRIADTPGVEKGHI